MKWVRALLIVGLVSGLFACSGGTGSGSPDASMGNPIEDPDGVSGDVELDTGTMPDPDAGATDGSSQDSSVANDTSSSGDDTGSASDATPADTPSYDTGSPDTNSPPADTAMAPSDTGTTSPDTAAPQDTSNLCGGRKCGANASCSGGACKCNSGYTGNPYQGCTKTCSGTTCGTNATCSGGTCKCKSGYQGDPTKACYKPKSCSNRSNCGSFTLCVGGKCTCEPGFKRKSAAACSRPSVGKPGNRSKSQVCTKWKSRVTNPTASLWATTPVKQCDHGKLKDKVQWEALKQTNIYRWLLGLDPLHAKQSYIDKNQECATVLAAEGMLTHSIKSSFKCYTNDAKTGAGRSNLAYGRSHPAPTVAQYIRDRGLASLGHRRWIFSPSVGATGFGHRGSYGCMWTIDSSGTDQQKDMYYPAPGYFPKAAIHGKWSYLSAAKISTSGASVQITEVQTGNPVSVTGVHQMTRGTYGRVTGVSWNVPNAKTGVEYKVTISGLGGGQVKSYKTTLVSWP